MSEAGFGLSEAQLEIRDMARRLAREVYAPKALEVGRAGGAPSRRGAHAPCRSQPAGITLPVEHGGGGQPLLHALIVIEEIARASQIAAFPIFEASTGPARVIDLFGTEEQRARFLPPVARGEKTIAVAISEPDAGSAATDLQTRAGDPWPSGGRERPEALVLRGRTFRAVSRVRAIRRYSGQPGYRCHAG